jgi:hypothetical protein
MKLGRFFRRLGLPPWTFLGIGLSGILVTYIGLAGEVVIQEVFAGLGLSPGWVAGLTPFVVLALVLLVIVAFAAWQGRRTLAPGRFGPDPLPKPEGKRGIVILVSRADSAMYAIEYHYRQQGTLRYVWLIPSSDDAQEYFGASSRETVDEIVSACEKLQAEVEAESGQKRPLDAKILGHASPADAQDTFDLVNRVYRTYGPRLELESEQIIADFTGGTKPMSVGMIMACLQTERSLQYVPFNLQERTMSGPFTIDYQHSAFNLIG